LKSLTFRALVNQFYICLRVKPVTRLRSSLSWCEGYGFSRWDRSQPFSWFTWRL